MSLFDKLPELDRDRTKALEAVEAICKGAGWTVERVGFGDDVDLKLGIPSGCELPEIPVWIGIEAKRNLTQYRKRGTHHAVPLHRGIVERSLARREPTIFVLWNVERRSGFWANSIYLGDEIEFIVRRDDRPTFVFHDALPFSASTANFVADAARVEWCSALLARHLDQSGETFEHLSDAAAENIALARLRLILGSLAVLGFWKDGPTQLVIEAFRSERSALLEDPLLDSDSADVEAIEADAVANVIADRIDAVTRGQVSERVLMSQLPIFLKAALVDAGEIPNRYNLEE
jgi:hypothetical protein